MFYPPFPSSHTSRPIKRLFWGQWSSQHRWPGNGANNSTLLVILSGCSNSGPSSPLATMWASCKQKAIDTVGRKITRSPRSISDVWPGRTQLDKSAYHIHVLPVVRSANGRSELAVRPAESERPLRRFSCLFARTSFLPGLPASIARLTCNLVSSVEWLSRVSWICLIVVPKFVGSLPPPHWLRPAAGRHRYGWGLQTFNAAERSSGGGRNTWTTCGWTGTAAQAAPLPHLRPAAGFGRW